MYFDKHDYRGFVLFCSLMAGCIGLVLLIHTWDLPPGSWIGRNRFTMVAVEGDTTLRPYALACFGLSAGLACVYSMKGWWKL